MYQGYQRSKDQMKLQVIQNQRKTSSTFKVDDTPMVVHPEKIDFRRFV